MFDSELDRFEWLVNTLLSKTEQIEIAKLAGPNHLEVMLVATGLIERALSYSAAVLTLVKTSRTSGTAPLQRAIYELWIEHTYLLTVGEPWINGVKAHINATLETLEFAEGLAGKVPPDDVNKVKRNITSWEQEYPAIVKEVRAQRQRRRFHWSGLSRLQMERIVMPAPDVYKMLSWEAHAVLSPIRDVEFINEGSSYTLRFEPKDTITVDQEAVSWHVGGILYYMWDKYADFFGMPSIEIPVESMHNT